MKQLTFISIFIVTIVAGGYLFFNGQNNAYKPVFVAPTEVHDASSEQDEHTRKEAYKKLIHRAAPDVCWQAIEEKNSIQAYYSILRKWAQKTTATFAGGAIEGTWYEKGNDNICGRINQFDFQPITNKLYAMADGGSIWSTSLPTVSWRKVSDAIHFNPSFVTALPRTGGGTRLFASSGTMLWYTDDEGTSFDSARGITFPVAWGVNRIVGVYPMQDAARTIYCVTFGWGSSPWAACFKVFASVDSGRNFSFIRRFYYTSTDKMDFAAPLGSNALLAMGVSNSAPDSIFSISNSLVTTLGTTTTIDTTDNSVMFDAMREGGTTHLYAITGGDHIYHSTDNGNRWIFKNTLSSRAWILGLSQKNPNEVYYGDVEAYRSSDSGSTFTRVNTWGSYYGDIVNKLHADLRSFRFFRNPSTSAEFGIVGTDGGAWLTNDACATVQNITTTGIHVSQLYDHITHPTDTNIQVSGSQDQGLQHTNTGGGSSIYSGIQVISGDYGMLRLTGDGNIVWPEYPGGWFYLYKRVNTAAPAYMGAYHLLGATKSNAGWMLPTAPYFNDPGHTILTGGGEISGDTGSYLVRLTLDTSAGFRVIAHQYSFDFRRNSNDTTSGLSAIATSRINNALMYGATEDGTFFYSTDTGNSWTKTLSFPGLRGFYLYGSTILPSVDSVDKVYLGGSGYSNPGVYVSRDHGRTFNSMSIGLPNTLVHRLASYSNDSFLFAATEAGPYVFVKADNRWYSLYTTNVPIVDFRGVEYIPSIKTARFSTYGRGVWDFNMRKVINVGFNESTQVSQALSVAPNPCTSNGWVTFFAPFSESLDLTLVGMDGKCYYTGPCTANIAMRMPSLPSGIYLAQLHWGTQQQTVRMLVQ